jgi:outer membrane murein-binding lipoprotein Lpp
LQIQEAKVNELNTDIDEYIKSIDKLEKNIQELESANEKYKTNSINEQSQLE